MRTLAAEDRFGGAVRSRFMSDQEPQAEAQPEPAADPVIDSAWDTREHDDGGASRLDVRCGGAS